MGYIAPIQPDLYFQYSNRPAPQDKEDYESDKGHAHFS